MAAAAAAGKKRRRAAAGEGVIDRRAVGIALALAAAGIGVGVVWSMTVEHKTMEKPQEFEFSADQPKPDEVKLKDPTPPVVEEREVKPDTPEVMPERPNIQMSTKPEPNPQMDEVIKSENTLVDTPKIDPSSQVTVEEAPTELQLVAEDTQWAEDVIAIETTAVAQHVLQKEPPPSNRKMGRFNQAPKASVAQTSVPKSFGDPNAATDGPVGPMDLNLFGNGTSFITNTPFGSVQARTAVDLALSWLARHQDADGAWRAEKYEGQPDASLAMTGLATLAFLGANYHTRSKHVYRLNVIRAVDYMLKNQEPDGRVAKGVKGISMSYTHAICTTALAEAYGRARDETLQSAAQSAINATVVWQNNDGGWRYQPKQGPSDTSVTAWFMQALKAGKMAQLKFDNAVLSRGQGFIDTCTDNNGGKGTTGAVTYILEGPEATRGGGNNHPALTSAGMLVRQFQRVPIQSEVLQKGAALTREKGMAPDWKQKDFYRWYYATYAMHNMGGEHRLWWNRNIREVLLANQEKRGEYQGSWNPEGEKHMNGGRVYTTALGALCLEVSYRYDGALQTWGKGTDLTAELEALGRSLP